MSQGTISNPIIKRPRERAVSSLRGWIAEGVLRRGERLPSEQAMADRLGISRPTLSAAVRDLQNEGIIRVVGSRRVVADAHPADVSKRNTIMQHAIAVLTTVPIEPISQVEKASWERHIESGAMEAIRLNGLHGLALFPATLVNEGLKRLIDDPPLGVLFSRRALESAEGQQVLAALVDAGVRAVVYGDAEPLRRFDRVASDHAAGAGLLTRWLQAQGRRRVLRVWAISEPLPAWLEARDLGHEAVCRELALPIIAPIRPIEPPIDGTQRCFENLARLYAGHLLEHLNGPEPVDALMCVTDQSAYIAAAACRLLGRVPGRDLLIAGYDNYWKGAEGRQWEKQVPAVTIDKQNPLIGHEMVKLLMARINGELSEAPTCRLLEPKLVVVKED